MIILFVVLFFAVVFAICLGKYPVSAGESLSIILRAIFRLKQTAPDMTVNVVLRLRLPRILASIFVGAALSISGSTYQGIFKNPLVSPDFLGVSSGACIGAAIGILLNLSAASISIIAFVGGIIAVLLTASLPALMNNRSNIMLVLAGIIVGSLMSSILGFIKYIADPTTQLASITYWTMGSFQYSSFEDIITMLIIFIPAIAVLLLMSWWIDVLSMGVEEAKSLGANVRLVRAIAILCSTVLTSGSVCIAGTIGWVGLIIPHFARMLVGVSNRKLMPASCLLGGLFMLIVDTLTRTIGIDEMPVSIMTGVIGAPFFIWLLVKRRNQIQ
ncbi:MAG: iron ABC transporter permease [Clostridia bacterium]|nr:iron ABC transporter permease [Clostridia bacterium]